MTNHVRAAIDRRVVGLFAAAALALFGATAQAQPDRWQPATQISSRTTVAVRTTEPINVNNADGLVFHGVVDNDIMDTQGQLAIPRGATAELMVKRGPSSELSLDLDSITINGHRYAVDTVNSQPVGTAGSGTSSIGVNRTTGEYIGGGALLGTIIGAAAGGGKGAAIGAAVGAAAGAGVQVATHGTNVNVPAETVLTYRLDRPLSIDIADTGYDNNGRHYHRYR
jgi:hypothetical protein